MGIVRSAAIFFASALTLLIPALARAECIPLPSAVTSIFPFSQVTPGGGVILLGNNFGSAPGKFEIFLTNYQGTPVSYELQNVTWGNNAVSGIIPDYAFEVLNQTALFLVVPQCGPIAIYPAPFTASTSYALVPTDRIGCWSVIGSGASDKCNNTGGMNYPVECFKIPPPFGTGTLLTGFGGYHASGWGAGSPSGGPAPDYFWAALNNGWVFEGLIPDASEFQSTVATAGSGSFAGIWSISSAGSSFPQIQINWHVDACGYVNYYSSDMLILGPTLVPY